MRSNSIDRVVVSKTNPHNNNVLWIDTSNGEKNAVLKYKGHPIAGGASGGDSGGSGGGGSTGGATIVLPKELDWNFGGATVYYSVWPKSGDILLVPYYPQTDGVQRLLPVLINSIIPESELPSEEPFFNLGSATLIGEVVEDGTSWTFVGSSINGSEAGMHLMLEPGDNPGEYAAHFESVRG